MVSHTRSYDPDFEPTRVQAALLNAVEQKVGWDHFSTLLDLARNAPGFDPTVSWDDRGNTMLGAILRMSSRNSSYYGNPSQEVLDQILELDPLAAKRKNIGGIPVVHMALDEMRPGERFILTLPWWIKHADRQDLLSWVSGDARRYDTKPDPKGSRLLEMALTAEADKLPTSALPDLFALGISPNVRFPGQGGSPAGSLAASGISSIPQWEAYLAAGGDPTLVVREKDPDYPDLDTPLWSYLIDRKGEELSKHVAQWARDNVADQLKSKKEHQYWALLEQKANYTSGANEIPGLLISHPEFATLRDGNGRNCLMYGIQMHASAWRALAQKRFAKLLHEKDAVGHSLWHYGMKTEKRMNVDMARLLLDNGVSNPPDIRGRGLVPGFLLATHPPEHYSWKHLRFEKGAAEVIAKELPAHDIWAVSEEEAPKAAQALLHYVMPEQKNVSLQKDARNVLLALATKGNGEGVHPYMLGAMILFSFAMEGGKHLEVAKQYAKIGARLDIPGIDPGFVAATMGQHLDELVAIGDDLSLRQTTPSTNRNRNRLRL